MFSVSLKKILNILMSWDTHLEQRPHGKDVDFAMA